MEENFNVANLDEEYFILYFISKELIPDNYHCSNCDSNCTIIKNTELYRSKINYCFYCEQCSYLHSIYKNTIFEKVFTDLKTFFLLMKYSVSKLSYKSASELLLMNGKLLSAIQVYRYYENV
jgi:hypothetical protein